MTKTIGIIGCGKQAEKHILGFKENGVSNIFVTDINKDLALELANKMNVEAVNSVDDLFDIETLDAVDICTPTPTHAPLIMRAIDKAKHFLVEKPLSSSLDEAQKIAKAMDGTDVIGAVGFTYRFAPALVKIKELLDSTDAELGEVITGYLRIGGRGSHALWKHNKATGGGAIKEMLVHMVDLAVWYFGEIESVETLEVAQYFPQREIGGKTHEVDAEDYVIVKLKAKSGEIVTLIGDFITPSFVQYAEIQGTGGAAFGSIQPHFGSYIWKNKDGNEFQAGKTELNLESRNIVADLVGNFIKAIDKKEEPRCSVKNAVEVQRILDIILLSAN